MPTFLFNKLVRDRLKEAYKKLGQQAEYGALTDDQYRRALLDKLAEEVGELTEAAPDCRSAELADIEQVLHDFMTLESINPDEVEQLRLAKLIKKGGFAGRTFVKSLTLADDDEWVAYYRKNPKRFTELPDSKA